MGAQLKEVRGRIQSVKSTQQITKAMKMVSAAKLRRAQDAITRMRPYAEKLNEILENIVASMGDEMELKLAEQREVKRVLVVAISSDKGLAGSYNSNIIKSARSVLMTKYHDQYEQGNVTLMPIGKKVNDYYKRKLNEDNIDNSQVGLFATLNFDDVSDTAEFVVKKFLDGSYDVVEVVYSQFKNAVVQEFKVDQFLPIARSEPEAAEGKPAKKETDQIRADYIFEPGEQKIMEELVPKILRTTFYKYMLDANASEHGARMTAMDKATDNAQELLKELRLTYNRARQAAITTELSEIVGGAAALEG